MPRYLTLCAAVVALLAGPLAPTRQALGQVSMQFPVTKDLQITSINFGEANEQLAHIGGTASNRVRKFTQDVTLFDFDTEAMAAFLSDNPGSATWTLNIFPSTHLFQLPTSDEDMPTVLTVESLNDWAETLDTNLSFTPLAWDPDGERIPAATYFYAQTVIDPETGEVDVENSLPWVDPDSGVYTFTDQIPAPILGVPELAPDGETWDRNPTPALENSEKFTRAAVNNAQARGNSASINLDAAIVDSLINDPNNRGLRFGPIELPFSNSTNTTWGIWSKDESGGIFAPFLEVTVVPFEGLPGDFNGDGAVDAADYTVWRDNEGAAHESSLMGNGNGVGGVDGDDYLLWRASYGDVATGTNGSSTVAPEPTALASLLMGAACAWGAMRRSSRAA